jgi:hypothetical protein
MLRRIADDIEDGTLEAPAVRLEHPSTARPGRSVPGSVTRLHRPCPRLQLLGGWGHVRERRVLILACGVEDPGLAQPAELASRAAGEAAPGGGAGDPGPVPPWRGRPGA